LDNKKLKLRGFFDFMVINMVITRSLYY
jgi:hypothetical protein